ncbi:MAG: class III extradiol ring-cleavage dioxygenase [Hyphomonas sp.]
MPALPSLFISHGAPSIALDPSPARYFLSGLGDAQERPWAIIVISAHHVAGRPTVTSGLAPRTIHDFGGFPDELYRMTYPAPGDPALAEDVVSRLKEAGFDAISDPERGFDHGAWVPLRLMYPEADIPVLQLSINMAETPEWHFRLGEALAPLREEGVMIIGSGSLTHNLRAVFSGGFQIDSPPPQWVTDFADWMETHLENEDTNSVLHAVQLAPHGQDNHPTMDHILPLFVAMGAGGSHARRIHHSTTYGALAMDAYAFGPRTTAQACVNV